jgi:hypothetical protein
MALEMLRKCSRVTFAAHSILTVSWVLWRLVATPAHAWLGQKGLVTLAHSSRRVGRHLGEPEGTLGMVGMVGGQWQRCLHSSCLHLPAP